MGEIEPAFGMGEWGEKAATALRATVNLSQGSVDAWQLIQARFSDATLTEALNKGLQLWAVVLSSQESGVEVLFRYPDGEIIPQHFQ